MFMQQNIVTDKFVRSTWVFIENGYNLTSKFVNTEYPLQKKDHITLLPTL